MPTRRHSLGLAACLVALAAVPLMPGLGQAAEVVQIKPRILIMFDTSGSMAWNVAGANTQGDGTNEAWLAGRTCCPGLGGSRLYLAKEAMKSMLDACGDIDFALAKFAQRYSTTQPAGTNPWASNQYTGNQVAGTWDILRYSGDNTLFNVQANWLSVPFKDDSASEIRSWMDHREYSATTLGTPATSIYAGPFNDYKEQELRADGGTPVGPAIDAARAYLAAVRAAETIADPLLAACRPYSVILLTDGEADNAPDARAAVQNLHSDGIDTWVIGLALASNNLDQLAADGGGHFDPVTGRAFFADSEDSLSSILYQIVAGSVRTEICNNLDDDCDGLTDEGVRNRCNTCGAEPAETCNGIDDDCDGQTDEGLTPPAAFCSHVVGDPTGTRGECEPGVYQCNGAAGWVCSGGIPPRTERCNALDDDCDGATDESVTYTGDTGQPNQCSPSPYAGIGSCNWGTYTCSSGSWLCGGYGEPTLEGTQCDGDDNDCDGEADEGVSQLCGGGTVNVPPSVCRQGIQYCDSLLSQPGDPIWTTCYGSIEARTETCNLLDDNCDGFVDNGLTTTTHPWLNQVCGGGTFNTTPATCRQGAWVCKAGQKTCCRNGVATCDAPIGPVSEGTICDDFDNDCDGEVDESIRKQCWVGELDVPPLPNHGDAGQCVLGWRVCNPIGTGWDVCIGAVGPTSESCDNVDNDCDGQTDEGLSNVGACGGAPSGDPSEGECQVGVLSCSTGTLSCAGDVGPILEACDGKDNDCDGDTDEGIYRNCWSGTPPSGGATGICHMGVQQCIGNDVWSACAGDVLPAEYELCNNVDDDCDGQIDEDPQGVVGLLCNECGDVWECRPGGELFCAEANSSAEVCDGLDNDCDGQTDEVTIPCGGCADPDPLVCPAGYEAGACQRGFQYCDSANATPGNPVWLADCIGQVGPRLELCDGVDNDCDGETDEELSLVGQECSKGIGECDAATLQCVNVAGGTKTIACCASVDPVSGECVSPSGPTIEICDAKDNNCDSLTDENLFVPCGGCEGAECTADPNEGQCQQGTSRCVNGVWGGCLGSVGPGAESCNLLDDDCDGLTDEGVVFVPATCAHSNTADPNEGICTPGTWQCVAGQESCVGGIKPQFEICSGLDEDCDGKQDWDTDEELEYVGEPCGSSSLGVCKKGKYACECDTDLQECELNCVGEVNSSTEECDCLDNDCDGLTDEDIPAGAVCDNNENGGATGACTAGVMRCLDCQWTCDAPANAEEACNNIDDDCDGQTDENLAVECPAGNLCVEGECAPPCAGQEASCPAGKTCEEATNPNTGEEMRVCVDDVCSAGTAGALPCADNPYFCTEEGARPPCQCDAIRKECLSPCDGQECAAGQVCVASVSGNKVTGQCVGAGPGCYGTGCDVGQSCEDGSCADDPCADLTCEGDTYCKNGECVAACANQDCPVSCRDGECVDDPCAGKVCDVGLSCNKNTGQCERGDCWGKVCDYYQVCQDGQCVADPCWNVECPNGRRCVDGSCYDVGFEPQGKGGQDTDTTDTNTGGSSTDSTLDTSQDTDTTRVPGVEDGELTKVLATGAGGCLCAATPGRSGNGWGALWLLALPLLLVVVRAGRRRALVSVWLTVAMAALLGLGCQVEPFEFGGLSGTDSTSTEGTSTGETDTTGTGGTAGTSTFPEDTASGTETCGTGADDDCDGVDDDCDGQTDEDANLASPAHCGSCDNVCAFEHAFATCDNGECKRGECATFWYDRDNNPQDCEFFCQPTVDPSDNLDLCDGVDLQDTDAPYVGINNDCDTDGADEDVGLDTDPRNCGRCGHICRVSNAIALCEGGECRQGDCQADHYDFDSDTSNGCEYECELSNGGVEICDGKDNDCDNLTDENNADPGSVWGAQGGGACYEAGDDGCDTDGENCHPPCAPGTWKCTPSGLRCDGGVVAAKTESCDNLDNDCDGATDEEEDIPLMGPAGSVCAVQVGVCPEGHLRCARTAPSEARQSLCCADVDASGVCVGIRDGIPSDEDTDHCDGIDNDCDGRIDESPDNPTVGMIGQDCYFGQAWGDDPDPSLQGQCLSNPGSFRCYYGTWVCENAASPTSESCNNIDDNCDGSTDEGLFQECHTGDYEERGLCHYGLRSCVDGSYDNGPCEDELPPDVETCDALDNDCDGQTDETADLADTNIGEPCNTGICQGLLVCSQGSISCSGGLPPTEEIPCNQKDDDCDAETDEWSQTTCGGCDGLDPVNGGCALGPNAGACQQGTRTCSGETPVCDGDTGPVVETCNEIDDDCDGETDEGFNKLQDAQNCGDCGVSCNLPHVVTRCDGGECKTTGCAFGYVDLDTDEPGCEYPCIRTGAEICDGKDNDCNGLIDEADPSLYRPVNFCRQLGECAGSEPVCTTHLSIWGWYCNYDITVELAPSGNPNQVTIQETLCDGLDNDCDAQSDESFPLKGQPCSEVVDPDHPYGICLSTGSHQCATSMAETECKITSAGQPPASESCNGRDDDCDGTIDNGDLDAWIAIAHHSLSFEIYKYEASRVDATELTSGIAASRSCSKLGVLPWAGATFDQARAACAAAGGRLCNEGEWLAACEGALPFTAYPYGDAYEAQTCNGKDYQGAADVVVATGSLGACLSDDGAFDLSGNLREWTLDPTDPDEDIHVVRGGSFNTPAIGLTCAFTMSRADNDVVLPAIGFRCCRD